MPSKIDVCVKVKQHTELDNDNDNAIAILNDEKCDESVIYC